MPEPRQNRPLATMLAHLTLLGAAALPLMALAIWFFWDQLAPHAVGNLQYAFDVTNIGVGARLSGFTLSLAGAVIQAYGLLGLRQTFLEAAEGRSLSARAVKGFRRFAWVTLAMVFVGIIQHTGLIVILSLSEPGREGTLSFQFGTNEIKALYIGALLVFVAHVFAEGKQAKEENEAFL